MRAPKPPYPGRFLQFFRWMCNPDFLEELEGDLMEHYHHNSQLKGTKFANNQFRKEVISMIRPSVIRNFGWSSIPKLNTAILRSHTTIAIRNVTRHKVFSIINISGLAIGMAVSLLIISLLSDLLKFDHFHTHKDRIYRIISHAQYKYERTDDLATAPLPLAEAIGSNFDGIDGLTRFRRNFSADASVEGKILPLKGHLVDQNFFDIFSFDLIKGNPETALSEPFSLVITEKAAQKMFGTKDPIGQIIKMGSFGDFSITGLLRDLPLYSHLQFEVLGSMNSLASMENNGTVRSSQDKWDDVYSNYIYLLISPSQSAHDLEMRINDLTAIQYTQLDDLDVSFSLQPLLGIVPGPELSNKIGPTFTPLPLIIIGSIALLILLSACFNYTNLSLARSLRRSREIGIRKVVGGGRLQIVSQFLTESVVIALIALGFAVLIFFAIKPGFFQIIPRADQFELSIGPGVIFSFILFAILSGILAGLIPSLILSRIKPVLALKDMIKIRTNNRFTLRKVLITFQIALSMIFIAGAAIVLKQYNYTLNKDLGFQQNNILNVNLNGMDPVRFKNEFSKLPEVTDLSFSSLVAGLGSTNQTWVGVRNGQDSIRSFFISVDENYIEQHEMELIAGADFNSKASGIGKKTIIVNQSFLRTMQWTIPETLDQWVTISGDPHQIVGIVKDFNYTHLEEPIGRFFFIQNEESFGVANLTIASSDISRTMDDLEKTWVSMSPSNTFSARFLEEQLDRAYDFLKNAMTLFGFLAFLAISIATLGMLGMAMYSAEIRAKEVSIRKVFGASVWQIYHTLSTGLYNLMIFASLVAIPLVYLLFDRVILANFAFRVKVGALELFSGLIVVFILVLLTVGSQTFYSARANPVEALRGL